MKKLALFFLIVSVSLGLSAAKIHKVGVHPKVVTVADNRYTISEFENSGTSEAVGRTAAVLTIADAVTLLDGHGGIIQVENETPVDADLTIPSNVMLVLPPTAVFNVAATKTLTINCQVQGVVTNTGSGTVAYGTSYSSPTSFPGPVHEYYVDGGRTDSYTADGSITRPYSTIKLATDAVNADVLVHGTAGTGDAANYRIHVGAGTYTGNLTITGPRSLKIEGTGVVISGTIAINSGVGAYDRIEFVGTEGNRSEKGPAMTLSGAMTFTRSNDSLIYVAFKGCYITGALSTVTDGTWVLCYKDCRVNGAITGTFSAAGHPSILMESFGFNEFVGTISGKTSFYNMNGADIYSTINTTPYYENRFRSCTFGGSVTIAPQTPSDSAVTYLDSTSYVSLKGRTPTLTGVTLTALDGSAGLLMSASTAHEIYVNGSRADTYTADGSLLRPYTTILAATTAINADVLLHGIAGTGDQANYIVHVGAGTYSGNLTITGPRYLRIEGAGVVISGTIAINSGVGSYDHIEFVGQQTGFSEKGPAMTLSGAMTCTRSNDSLIYVSFKGCYITGTLDTVTDGTWVIQYDGCRVNGAITGTFSASGHPAILLITHGWNEFAGAISGKLAFYDANGSDFYGAINTTPYYASKFKGCTFNAAVSIIPASPADSTAINCDANSLSSLLGRTPTTTGATINNLDNIGTLAAAKTVTLADNYVPVQANVVSIANPASGYTLGGAYFKAAITTADQANTQIVGVLARASMGKNATDAYGVQSHTTLVDGAESTGNMTAVSGKTILYDDNASGIVSAGLFTLEGQVSGTHGAVPRKPTTAYGVWADIVDTNITAGFVLNANNSAVGSGLTLSKSGSGTITKDITLQNGETLDNATDGTVVCSGAFTTGGAGVKAAVGNVAVENAVGSFHTTTLTLTNVALTVSAAGAGVGFGNVQLYDFPEGYIYFIGAVSDLAITAADDDIANDWDGDIAFGTTADADGSLASTEVNVVPSTGTPQAANDDTTADTVSTATEHAIVDGHTSALDLFLNFLIDAADITDATSGNLVLNGTVTVTWIKLGDN